MAKFQGDARLLTTQLSPVVQRTFSFAGGVVKCMMFGMGLGGLSRRKVKCGICSHEQTIFVGRETFTCRKCKKTLPRRLALAPGTSFAAGSAGQPRDEHPASA
jgi:hypothetical protein